MKPLPFGSGFFCFREDVKATTKYSKEENLSALLAPFFISFNGYPLIVCLLKEKMQMSFTKAFGFFFIILAFIICYMNYTFYQEYNSAIKSKRAMFKIESCERVSGKIKKTYAIGEIIGQGSKGTVNITEYIKYLTKNNPTSAMSSLELCKKGTIVPVWEYDIGILRGRDISQDLQSDSIRAANLYQNIKFWLLASIIIFMVGVLMVKKSNGAGKES